MATPIITPASPEHWPDIRNLLESEKLPVSDLDAGKLGHFFVALDDEQMHGVIGLQLFGELGLLRSLVVTHTARSHGVASALLNTVEMHASDCDVAELWLLTNTAEDYFFRHGYRQSTRADAPGAIQRSEEFADLCPADVTIMRKRI